MAIPTRDNAHVAEGLARLTDMFKNKKNTKGILTAFLTSLQELEGVFWDIINKRRIDYPATGAQLDTLGRLVGESRQGRGDVSYLAAVRLRIAVNRSQGRASDVVAIAILAALGSPVDYFEGGNKTFQVTIPNLQGPDSVTQLLGEARAAGSYGVLRFTTWASGSFVCGSSSGYSVPTATPVADTQHTVLVYKNGSAQTCDPPT